MFRKFMQAYIKKKKLSSTSEYSYVAATPTILFSTDEACDFTSTSNSSRAAELLFFGRQCLAHSETDSPITCCFISVLNDTLHKS